MIVNISVLIPVYNAEKTICKTLDSLMNQTRKDFEIVVVDDGSSDTTPQILREYQNMFQNMKIYRQQNLGVAAARNRLVEIASGTHLVFCDADDYLEKYAIELIFDTLNKHNVDLIVFGYKMVRAGGDKTVLKRQLSEGIYRKNQWEHLHVKGLTDLYWSVLWNKCFKKEIVFSGRSICFQKVLEDVTFNVEYMGRCRTVYILEKSLYNYMQIGDSLTRSKKTDSEQHILDAFKAFSYLYEALQDAYGNLKRDINLYTYRMMCELCRRAENMNSEDLYSRIVESNLWRSITEELGQDVYKVHVARKIGQIKNSLRKVIKR